MACAQPHASWNVRRLCLTRPDREARVPTRPLTRVNTQQSLAVDSLLLLDACAMTPSRMRSGRIDHVVTATNVLGEKNGASG
jgi:hypothetical protein